MKRIFVFLLTIFFNLYSLYLNGFGYGISNVSILDSFEQKKEVNGFISNDLTHETFSPIDGTDKKDSSIFFIIGKIIIQLQYYFFHQEYNHNCH